MEFVHKTEANLLKKLIKCMTSLVISKEIARFLTVFREALTEKLSNCRKTCYVVKQSLRKKVVKSWSNIKPYMTKLLTHSKSTVVQVIETSSTFQVQSRKKTQKRRTALRKSEK